MANAKLKSIFTQENTYTVLQLLKALAEGCDDVAVDGVAMEKTTDGKNKIVITLGDGTKVESEPFTTGSALDEFIKHDATTNTTDIGTNAEVDGNLQVNGKIVKIDDTLAFGYLPMKAPEGIGVSVEFTAPAVIFVPSASGKLISEETAVFTYSGAYARIVGNVTYDGQETVLDTTVKILNASGEQATTMDEVINGGYISFELILQRMNYIKYDSDLGGIYKGDTQITRISDVSIERAPTISGTILGNSTTVDGTTYLSDLQYASKAKYQHTLVITYTNTSIGYPVGRMVVQAMSSKNTKIDSYQDLNEVFGGELLKWGGYLKQNNNIAEAYGGTIDLHGGTIATDKINGFATGVTTTGGTFSSMMTDGTFKFEDDVCVPK